MRCFVCLNTGGYVFTPLHNFRTILIWWLEDVAIHWRLELQQQPWVYQVPLNQQTFRLVIFCYSDRCLIKRDSILFNSYRNPIMLHVALMGKLNRKQLIVLYKSGILMNKEGVMEERHTWNIFCYWFYFITEVGSLDVGCNWKSPGWYHYWYCFGYTLYVSILSSILILIQYALLYLCLIIIFTLSTQYYVWINISLWLNLLVFLL